MSFMLAINVPVQDRLHRERKDSLFNLDSNKDKGFKEVISVLMLCAPVFIFTSGSSALLGRPRCGLSI